MEIPFHGQYDKELFFRSVQLANRPAGNRRYIRTFMLVFIAAAVVVLVSRLIESGDVLSNTTYIALIMLVGAFLVRSYLQPQFAARDMWRNPSVQRTLRGVITKKGITYRLKEGTNEIPWERFLRVRKTKNLTTLTTRDGLLLIFPQRFFKNESDWQRFNSLIDSKVVGIN